MSDNKNDHPMDSRCPRNLEKQPESWCPMAVMRLKALRNADHELTEEEENNLPGCPWAVNHQLANYCFFNYVSQFLNEDGTPSVHEVAHLLNLSTETVSRVQKDGLQKMRETGAIKEIKDIYGDEQVVDDQSVVDIFTAIK